MPQESVCDGSAGADGEMTTKRPDLSTLPIFSASKWQMSHGERSAFEGLLSQVKPRIAVEIGTAEGGSLRRIAAHSVEVHSFDMVAPPDEVRGLENVSFHTGDSHQLVPEFLAQAAAEERSIDFVLIDGDHSAEGVRRDIVDVLGSESVRRTVVVLHDTLNPEVRRGIVAAAIAEHPKVAKFELDLVPGYLARREPYRLTMWGGLGLIVVDPDERQRFPAGVRDERFHELFSVLHPTVEVMKTIEASGVALDGLPGHEVESRLRSTLAETAAERDRLARRLRAIEGSRGWRLVLAGRRARDLARDRLQPSDRPSAPTVGARTRLGAGLDEVLEAERSLMPADVYEIKSMLGYDERLLLHWAARTAGPGALVDLGAFLGGSTLALASGAEATGATVYSHDRFVLSADWERTWLPDGAEVAVGDSTRPVFDSNVARVRERVVVREGEVETHGWHDGAIAVLFVDITKSWETADYVWRTFLPSVRAGGLVIQQDLVHWGHPWCAIIMELLSDHFEYLGWAWYSSAVYRCTSPVTAVPERLLDALTCDQMVELVDRAARRVGPPAEGSIRLSAVHVYAAFGRYDEARALIAEIRANYDDRRMPHIEQGLELLPRVVDDQQSRHEATNAG